MSGEIGETNRNELLLKATDHEFVKDHGRFIADQLETIIAEEIECSRQQPNLWILPHTAAVEPPPQLDEQIKTTIQNEWLEFVKYRSKPDRDIWLRTYSRRNRETELSFKSTLTELKKHCWRCDLIKIGKKTLLPLIIEQTTSGPHFSVDTTIVGHGWRSSKPGDFLTEIKDFVDLASLLSNEPDNVQQEVNDKKPTWIADHNERLTNQIMALNFLINDPQTFLSYFTKNDMVIIPNRLMTPDEYQYWQNTYNSFANLLPPNIDYFPVPVKQQNHLLGYTVLEIDRSANDIKINFKHGAAIIKKLKG